MRKHRAPQTPGPLSPSSPTPPSPAFLPEGLPGSPACLFPTYSSSDFYRPAGVIFIRRRLCFSVAEPSSSLHSFRVPWVTCPTPSLRRASVLWARPPSGHLQLHPRPDSPATKTHLCPHHPPLHGHCQAPRLSASSEKRLVPSRLLGPLQAQSLRPPTLGRTCPAAPATPRRICLF